MPLPPRRRRTSLVRGVYARYAPTGHLLVVTADGKLIAIPFDPKKLELTGAPVALHRGDRGAERRLQHRPVARRQRHAGLHHRRHARLPARGVGEPRGRGDAGGLRRGIRRASSSRPPLARREGAGGRRCRGTAGATSGSSSSPTGPFSRITFGDTSSVRPAWSADGRDVLYVTDRSGSGVGPVYAHRADGTGAPRLLIASARSISARSLASRDGRWLILRTAPVGAGSTDILGPQGRATRRSVPLVAIARRRSSTRRSRPTAAGWPTRRTNRGRSRSTSGRSPRPRRPSGRCPPRAAASRRGRSTGRELFYINGKSEMVSAEIPAGATFSVGKQRTLFSAIAVLPRRADPVVLAEPRRQALPDGARGRGDAAERADRGGELAGGAAREVILSP